jgi:hypothetical protein
MSDNDDFPPMGPGVFRQHVFGDASPEARIAFMELCELDERIRHAANAGLQRVNILAASLAKEPAVDLLLPLRQHQEFPLDVRYPFLAVRVTAADFNGKTFDGSPLVVLREQDEELVTMLAVLNREEKPKVRIESRGGTDYAWFGIVDDYNNVTWAGPGDYIVAFKKESSALTAGRVILRVVPGEFYEMIFKRESERAKAGTDATGTN